MKTIFTSELGALISDIATATSRARERNRLSEGVQKHLAMCKMQRVLQKWVHPLPKNFMPCWKYFAVGSQNFLQQHCSSTMFKILDVSKRTIFSAQWFGGVVAVERTIHVIFSVIFHPSHLFGYYRKSICLLEHIFLTNQKLQNLFSWSFKTQRESVLLNNKVEYANKKAFQ